MIATQLKNNLVGFASPSLRVHEVSRLAVELQATKRFSAERKEK